jgi:hypothetical protein
LTLRRPLAENSVIALRLFDAAGRRIGSRTLHTGDLSGGIFFDEGLRLAAGTYWLELRGPGFRSAERLVVLKD